MRAFFAAMVFLAGCGCREGSSPEVAAANAKNAQSLDAAMASAGLVRVVPMSENPQAQAVTMPKVSQPTVVDSPRRVLVFPPSSEAPELVRDRAGKLHELVVKHDVISHAGDRLCGCGPNGGGGTQPPPPPIYYVALEAGEDLGPPVTIVARWIASTDSHPNANDHQCHEIP